MFNVSIREYFSVLNVFIVCICNTAVFKLIPLLCTHVYSYMFSTVHCWCRCSEVAVPQHSSCLNFFLEMFSSRTLNPQASYLEISLTFPFWNPKHKEPQHGIKNFARLCLPSFLCQGTRDDKEILHAIKIGFLGGGGERLSQKEGWSFQFHPRGLHPQRVRV
jgi:hypothetical protein